MEYWEPIFPGSKYSVSTMGRMWSANIGVMKTPINNFGYPHLSLMIDGKSQRVLVHRLMATAFLPNPLEKREVNHINGIRKDNRIENLEWVTSSENKVHRYEFLGGRGADNFHRRKTVIAYRDGLPIVIEVDGIREMARSLNIPYQAVQAGIKKNKRTYFGWKFELLTDPMWTPKEKLHEVLPMVSEEERGHKLYRRITELMYDKK